MKIHDVAMYLITQRHLTHKNLLYMFAKTWNHFLRMSTSKMQCRAHTQNHETSSKLWLIKAKLTVLLVT